MDTNYLDVLSKNVLNIVKSHIKDNGVILDKSKEIEFDKKMLKIIKNIISDNTNIFKGIIKPDSNKEFNINVITSLIEYYLALYNDNLELLHKLLDINFNWGNYKSKEMNLFVLDKRFSKNFNLDEYIDTLNNNLILFKNFYHSLNIYKNNKDIDLNQIIEKFCNIIKINKNITIIQNNDSITRVDNLFTVDLLINFSEDEIINLTDIQKQMLTGFIDKKNKESQLKLDLIKKYNFSKKINLWHIFSEFFTIEDILNLSDKDIKVYERVFSFVQKYDDAIKLIRKAIEKQQLINEINPHFNSILDCIVYDILSIKQIMSLSENGIESINSLCSDYADCRLRNIYGLEINEKMLKYLIKEAYCMDKIKRNIKKLTKKA